MKKGKEDRKEGGREGEEGGKEGEEREGRQERQKTGKTKGRKVEKEGVKEGRKAGPLPAAAWIGVAPWGPGILTSMSAHWSKNEFSKKKYQVE